MELQNKNLVRGILIIILVGFLGGWFYWKRTEMRRSDQTIKELQTSLHMSVPPLPDTINVIGGKIIAVSGNAFTLEIPSFTDRYPKPGVPGVMTMKTETKTIHLAANTTITSVSFNSKTFKNGLPQQTAISAKDLKTGDAVSVTVKENARTEQNLTAVSVFVNRSNGI